jgi:hypothetical protein
MDACLELLLPHTIQLNALEWKVPSFIWGGINYPQGPERVKWGEFVEIVRTPIAEHLRKYLPANSGTETWVALSIRGEGLDLLQREVNGSSVDWHRSSLEDLLRSLLSNCSTWLLVFELHCDQIDSIYRMSVDQCIDRLKQNLRYEVRSEGFVVTPT